MYVYYLVNICFGIIRLTVYYTALQVFWALDWFDRFTPESERLLSIDCTNRYSQRTRTLD